MKMILKMQQLYRAQWTTINLRKKLLDFKLFSSGFTMGTRASDALIESLVISRCCCPAILCSTKTCPRHSLIHICKQTKNSSVGLEGTTTQTARRPVPFCGAARRCSSATRETVAPFSLGTYVSLCLIFSFLRACCTSAAAKLNTAQKGTSGLMCALSWCMHISLHDNTIRAHHSTHKHTHTHAHTHTRTHTRTHTPHHLDRA